jgi:hypothetical protein
VALGLVDLLEVVDVAQDQRGVAALLARDLDGGLEPLVERAAVRQPRQLVAQREVGHAREQLRAADRGGELPGRRAHQPHVVGPERGTPPRPRQPQLAPRAAAEHDRHRATAVVADRLQQSAVHRREVRVVERARVGLAGEHQLAQGVVAGQAVDLVRRPAPLAGRQLADVDQGAQDLPVGLPAADRERVGAERAQRRLARGLEHLGKVGGAGDRGGDAEQRAQLLLVAARAVPVRGRGVAEQRVRAHGGGLERVGVVQAGEERLDDARVELRPGAALELRAGGLLVERPAVRPVAHERVPGVAGEHDPRRQRDRVARQPVGVAAAVPALVLVAHGRGHRLQAGERPQDALADHGVLAHQLPLAGVEPARLVQHAVGHADLADVVQQRDRLHVGDLWLGEPEPSGDRHREHAHAVGVVARVAVARLERGGQRVHDRPVALGRPVARVADLAQRVDQRGLLAGHAPRGLQRLPARAIEVVGLGGHLREASVAQRRA